MTSKARRDIEATPICSSGTPGCRHDHSDDEPESGTYCEALIGLFELRAGQLLRLSAGRVETDDGVVDEIVTMTIVDGGQEFEMCQLAPATARRVARGVENAAEVAAGARTFDRYAS